MYRHKLEDVLIEYESSDKGLTKEEAHERRNRYGYNEIEGDEGESLIVTFFKNFKDVMIIILLVAATASFVMGERTDAYIILAIVILNAIISTVQSAKARSALESLRSMATPESVVLRDGIKKTIPSRELVPGDVVFLEAGNIIPADGRLLTAVNLKVTESVLTGESEPVTKDESFVTEENVPIGDRKNMVFGSTVVTYGRARYLVTQTGMNSEIGKIAFMILSGDDKETPLQKKLSLIGKIMATVVLIIAAGIFALGLFQGRDLAEMFFTAISLAVAAIPEGLPAVVTIVLALGVMRLSKKNAIVKNLPSVETLGSASVICSDKTGTLTQNKMKVIKAFLFNEDNKLLTCGMALCNDAEYSKETDVYLGDPTEIALIDFAEDMEISVEELELNFPRVAEIPFESVRKRMTTVHKGPEGYIQYTKGGLDEILSVCDRINDNGHVRPMTDNDKKLIHRKHDDYAKQALRILALAYDRLDDKEGLNREENLIFVGIVGMMDPPREQSADSIKKCKHAGITPVMITGDHLQTATAVATEIGILSEDQKAITGQELELMSEEELSDQIEDIRVYARVSPQHKVRIVKAWQEKNHIVAMTGDGVNDAPALKMSDIGVAMGQVGTDVSRSAADMVLADDDFSTIVAAVEEGRSIFDNIQRTIRFLISCNFGEIVLIVIAMISRFAVPLLPIHILWVNLVSDSFPALALGVETKEKNVMTRPPRAKDEQLLTGKSYMLMVVEGLLIGGLAFLAFRIGLQTDLIVARTMSFATIAFTQLIHSINLRSNMTIFSKGIFSNKYFVGAFLLSAGLMAVVLLIPFAQQIFKTTNLSLYQWGVVGVLSIVPLIFTEIRKIFVKG